MMLLGYQTWQFVVMGALLSHDLFVYLFPQQQKYAIC